MIVGVNGFVQDADPPIDTLYIDETVSTTQMERLDRIKRTRDGARVDRALDRLGAAAVTTENLMPPILDAVRAYATVGEMCDALRRVWGEYEETPII